MGRKKKRRKRCHKKKYRKRERYNFQKESRERYIHKKRKTKVRFNLKATKVYTYEQNMFHFQEYDTSIKTKCPVCEEECDSGAILCDSCRNYAHFNCMKFDSSNEKCFSEANNYRLYLCNYCKYGDYEFDENTCVEKDYIPKNGGMTTHFLYELIDDMKYCGLKKEYYWDQLDELKWKVENRFFENAQEFYDDFVNTFEKINSKTNNMDFIIMNKFKALWKSFKLSDSIKLKIKYPESSFS